MRLFIIPSIIFFFILIVCIIRSYSLKNDIVSIVRRLLITVLFPLIANVIIVLPTCQFLDHIGYIIYFIGTDFMLYSLTAFSIEYCKFKVNKQKILIFLKICIAYIEKYSVERFREKVFLYKENTFLVPHVPHP